MVKCAVRSCKNDTRKHTKQKCSVTFHRFPKDGNLMKKWIDALKQTNWEPNIWSKVCSVHFPDSSIYETKNSLRRLIDYAVPSLFLDRSPSPDPNLVETASSNSGIVKDEVTLSLPQQDPSDSLQLQIDSNEDMNTNACPVHQNEAYIGDTLINEKLKKKIVRLEDIAKRRRLRSNALYASRRRLKKKIENLSQLLDDLKEQRRKRKRENKS